MKHVRLVIAISFLMAALWPAHTGLAATYDVSASVPYPAPSQPAVVNPALNNIVVQNSAFIISGTCQVMNPVTVVSVLRGTNPLGSSVCLNGTFSLLITLIDGQNSLIVRTVNQSNAYGPDSAPITVTLTIPITPPPASEAPKAVATPGATSLTQTENTAFNTATKTGLTIVPQTPFTVLPSDNQVSLSFVVSGGSTPYTIELNWGDGTVETRTVASPGTYNFTHRYRSVGNYTVRGRVKDVLGAITEIDYAVVTAKGTDKKPSVVVTPVGPSNPVASWFQRHWLASTIVVSALALAAGAYWLGQTRSINATLAANSSVKSLKGKTNRRASKPKSRGKR